MPKRLGRGELLHPYRRPVAEWVDGVVVGPRRVPEDRPPEAKIDGVRFRCDRELNLLHGTAVGLDAIGSGDCRDGPCEPHVSRLELPEVAGQPHGEAVIEIRQVYEAEDFGPEFTPELRAQEDRLRAQVESKKQS